MDALGTHLLPDLQDCDADLLDDVDLVRDSQHYVLEITNYGEELKSILMDIHEPDPDDDSIRSCHRITAAQMIIDRVLGPAISLQQALTTHTTPPKTPTGRSDTPRTSTLMRL